MAKAKESKVEYGIKETKEVLLLGFAVGKAYKAAKQDDGEITMMDFSHLVNLFPVIGPAIEGANNIPNELKDLSKEEIEELMTFSAAHLGELAGSNEELVEKISKGLKAGLAILSFIKAL